MALAQVGGETYTARALTDTTHCLSAPRYAGETDTSSLLIYCEIVRPLPPEAVYEPPPAEPAPVDEVAEGEEGEPANGEAEGEEAEGTAEENGEEGAAQEKPEGEEGAAEEAEPKAEAEEVVEEAAAPEGEVVENGDENTPKEEVRGQDYMQKYSSLSNIT